MPKSKPLPPLAELREVLSYDPETGVFRWKVRVHPSVPAGTIANSKHSCGYLKFNYKRKLYYCHRAAWLFFYGKDPGEAEIDHINGNKSDNRITNLRLATSGSNKWNAKALSNNTSGYKGVFWRKDRNYWVGNVVANGVKYRKDGFPSAEDAYAWACAKREAVHGEFVNHGSTC